MTFLDILVTQADSTRWERVDQPITQDKTVHYYELQDHVRPIALVLSVSKITERFLHNFPFTHSPYPPVHFRMPAGAAGERFLWQERHL